MTSIIFKTEGFSELETKLSEMSKGFRTDTVLRNTVVKAIKKSLVTVEDDMRSSAPYDEKSDGPIHLRDTIRTDARIPWETDYKSSMVNQTDVAIGLVSAKKSAVSLSQEFGNASTPAHPFIRNALTRNYEKVIDTFRTELGAIVVDYAAKLSRRKK